jgi:ATP-dependent DNA helicase DinG
MGIADILGPDGTIARRLASYETRPQQLAMAKAVADAFDAGCRIGLPSLFKVG